MASKTQIGNLALTCMGVSKPVANIDTENSLEARTLKQHFDTQRDFVLRDFPWPFASAYATLGLVAGSSDAPANNEYTFAYRYPSDCLFARRLTLPGGRLSTIKIPFQVGRDSQGRLIYTDQEDAELKYTVAITEATEFDPLFVSMFAWRLAAICAPALSRVDNITKTCLLAYEFEKQRAQAEALNEGESDPPLDAEWIRGR